MCSHHVIIPFVLIHKLLMPISWMRTWQVQTAGNVQLISPEPTDGYLATQEGWLNLCHIVLFIDLASHEENNISHEVTFLHPLRCLTLIERWPPTSSSVSFEDWLLVDTGSLCLELGLTGCIGLPLTSRRTNTLES